MKNKLEIEFVDEECVEITLGQSLSRLHLDELGLPKFPESLKETLSPYLPEMVERWIKSKRNNPNQGPIDIVVSHKPWCREIRGTGRCNCNPDISDLKIREYTWISDGKLTCKMCEEFSTGEYSAMSSKMTLASGIDFGYKAATCFTGSWA